MEIRKFKESDRNDVVELWKNCGLTRAWNDPHKDIDRKIEFQAELFFIGVLNNKLMASAMAGYDGHRGSVFYLAINPDNQNKGYGQQLMTHIEKVLVDLGCPKINIVIRSSNDQVLDFYNNQAYLVDDVVSIGKRLIPDNPTT